MPTISNVVEFIEAVQATINSTSTIATESIMGKRLSEIDNHTIERGKAYIDALFQSQWSISRKQDMCQKSPQLKWFYRGHYSSTYNLIPSVFRGENWEKEAYYYHEMALRSPEHIQGKSHLDKLVTMQHYDCPTRLLDITSNPLVALFFACMNYGNTQNDHYHQGVVYVFSQYPRDVVYGDSDRALVLSCLAAFSKDEKIRIHDLANEQLQTGKFSQRSGRAQYSNDVIEKLYHEITREDPAFRRDIQPIHLLSPLFVQPNRTNMRIAKQDGAFILCGLSKNAQEAEQKLNVYVQEIIYIRNQEHILRELDQLGINEASLFPELDKVAHYLKTPL